GPAGPAQTAGSAGSAGSTGSAGSAGSTGSAGSAPTESAGSPSAAFDSAAAAGAAARPASAAAHAGSSATAPPDEVEQAIRSKLDGALHSVGAVAGRRVRFADTGVEDVSEDEAAPDGTPTAPPADDDPGVHFPRPPAHDLDPGSDNFLEQLHDTYFPSLAVDPSKLAWMQPVSDAETESSPYHPTMDSVAPMDIRFDFKGNLLPPSVSLALNPNLGLHHHGDSPAYAGYTILELAHLCRSSVAAQRAMAIRIVGRILYRLGAGAYGEYIGDGLWDLVDEGKVMQSIAEASDERTAHLGLRACATEALWLWKKGGGRRRKAQ
ncbi:RPAP1-like protein, partial [Dipodascopsis tothii]|uniref:RPAP1-like protein n=1 Tax=Dipodascopsis tothii TaxID=44089 RepID=UPI0034CD388A